MARTSSSGSRRLVEYNAILMPRMQPTDPTNKTTLQPVLGTEINWSRVKIPREPRLCSDGIVRHLFIRRTLLEAAKDLLQRCAQDEKGCWNWTGGVADKKRKERYGTVWLNGKRWKAHQLSFHVFKGPIPDGKMICHSCDNGQCVNPAHLWAGTNLENQMDSINKGRANREKGEDRYNARLSVDKIKAIRDLYVPRKCGIDQLASKFKVSRSMIFSIVKRNRWKHVL